MSNDSPPESYYIPPDFEDAGEEERKPRGQGHMSDREYILKLEDAIENAATESTQPCGFCESEDYARHIHGCVYSRIVNCPYEMMEHKAAQEERLKKGSYQVAVKYGQEKLAASGTSNQTSVATFGYVDREEFYKSLRKQMNKGEAVMLSVYDSEILLRKMSGG